MRIVDLKNPERDFPLTSPCALCLGHFDGVHKGHRELIKKLKEENSNRQFSLPIGAFCFTSPPKDYFSDTPTPQLTPLDEKLEVLRRAGLQFAVLYDFEEIKDLDAFHFVKDILIFRLNCRLLVCGYNYTFGKNAAGTPADLEKYFGSQPDLDLFVVPEVILEGESVSSSRIRGLLLDGHPEIAARLLGGAYSVTGIVRDGMHIGRTMETPTTNLYFPENKLVPRHGVYVSTIKIGNRTYSGISNVGVRPTFGYNDGVNCEAFLFDFRGDLYNKTITVSFVRFLREERAFRDITALQAQIKEDVAAARAYFKGEWG